MVIEPVLWQKMYRCNNNAGFDSDVDREKNIDYTSKFNSDPIRTMTGIKPSEQKYQDDEKLEFSS